MFITQYVIVHNKVTETEKNCRIKYQGSYYPLKEKKYYYYNTT